MRIDRTASKTASTTTAFLDGNCSGWRELPCPSSMQIALATHANLRIFQPSSRDQLERQRRGIPRTDRRKRRGQTTSATGVVKRNESSTGRSHAVVGHPTNRQLSH